MSVPRRKYTGFCKQCGRQFHPFRRDQPCCSRGCGAVYRHRRYPLKREWCQKGQQALQAKRWQAIAARVKGCQTLGDAYRLGRQDGYLAGWAKGRRTA